MSYVRIPSENKSDLIKLLKHQGKISGKITHIGDGKNDLEVWQAGFIDNFIGFGLNQVDKKVQKEAPIFEIFPKVPPSDLS